MMILDWLSMSAEQRWLTAGGLALLLVLSIVGIAVQTRRGNKTSETNGPSVHPKRKKEKDPRNHT